MAFAKARTEAQKILGKDAKIPKDKGIDKDIDAANKCSDEAQKASQALEEKLLAWKKAIDGVKESCQAFQDDIEGSDFGLNTKDAAQKKQIVDAQKVFVDAITAFVKNTDALKQMTEDTYKNVSSMGKRYHDLADA
jgi:septal ring factor EnvC (AmiA/AmiB activator)